MHPSGIPRALTSPPSAEVPECKRIDARIIVSRGRRDRMSCGRVLRRGCANSAAGWPHPGSYPRFSHGARTRALVAEQQFARERRPDARKLDKAGAFCCGQRHAWLYRVSGAKDEGAPRRRFRAGRVEPLPLKKARLPPATCSSGNTRSLECVSTEGQAQGVRGKTNPAPSSSNRQERTCVDWVCTCCTSSF